MNVQIDTSELDDLVATFAAVPAKVERVSSAEMTKVAAQFRDDAKASVKVDTGELRDSIHVQGGKDYRVIVADAEHAAYHEFGTSDTAPQPYMWPQVPAATERLAGALEYLSDPFD